MFESGELYQAVELIFYFLVSLGFFVGIVLMVSPEAFDVLNKALSKEYGIKTRLIPRIELKAIHILDKIITKNRTHGMIIGFIIASASFVLLLAYR